MSSDVVYSHAYDIVIGDLQLNFDSEPREDILHSRKTYPRQIRIMTNEPISKVLLKLT